ncbi:MAG: SpoIIE family protein phosphatase [Planctomycetes bacterium]|nr:SpoIIE family protein phosphatase [Planctomycetota bacterium]
MADRPGRRDGERRFGRDRGDDAPKKKPVVPPVVPPAVPPTVAPVARPVVPPTVPPTVAPAVPPTVAPAVPPTVAPVAKPVVPPTMPPVAPPVARPVAPPTVAPAAPPVARPVVAPSAPPTVAPAAPAAKAPASSKPAARAERAERDDRAPRGGARGGGGVPSGGMGVGAKVGLLTAVAAAAFLALAAVPSMRAGDGDDGTEAYHAAGLNAAIAFGSGLGGAATPAPSPSAGANPMLKAVEMLAAGVEAQVKDLALGGDVRSRIVGEIAVLKDAAAGRSPKKAVESQLIQVSEALKRADDEEKKKPLREQRDRLTKILELLDAGDASTPAPAAGGASLARPPSVSPYTLLAVWWLDPAKKVVAQSDKGTPLPQSSQWTQVQTNTGWFPAQVLGRTATVYGAPAGGAKALGMVYLAFEDPPATGGGGGSKLGLLALILGPIVVGLAGWLVASGHGKPIKDLARELDRLGSSGDPTRRIPAHGPEANAIARSVERMVSNLKFRSQHEMADLQDVMSKEQGVAAEIHHGLMPRNPPRLAGYEVETLFKPGFEIGGDHFDYFRIDDSHLGVILMDTSVRGIPAAIVMSMARAYVRAQAPGVLSPAELLMKVNRLLAADLSQGQYVTALYVVIDTSTGTAKVASAGHLPLVVYRHAIGKTAIVNPEGIALGLDVGPVFDRAIGDVDVEIGVGDRLVLHTDGALKVQDDAGDEYGEARLYDAIKQKAPMNSQAFVNFVGSAIDAFHATTPQNDDITISTVKRLK